MNWLIATIVVAAYILKLALDKAVTAVINAIHAESVQNRHAFRALERLQAQNDNVVLHLRGISNLLDSSGQQAKQPPGPTYYSPM